MKRLFIAASLAVLAGVTFLLIAPVESSVTVSDARAVPMHGAGNYVVSLTMKNDGPAVALTGVSTPTSAMVSLMSPRPSGLPVVIPGKGQGLLAMDGTHIMLSPQNEAFEPGAFLSISLEFDDGSTVAARVLHGEIGQLRHGQMKAVEVDPAPKLALTVVGPATEDGLKINLAVENFEFFVAGDDAAHVPNQGHAHVYLNGLKLGRLYEDEFTIGALKPGAYTVRVALNTNDHRPYAMAGAPIEAVYSFDIP